MLPVSGAEQLTDFGGDRRAAQHFADRRIFEVGQPHRAVGVAGFAICREKHIPEAALLRLGLALLDDRRELPAILGLLHLLFIDGLGRIDDLVHELVQLLEKRLGAIGVSEIHRSSPWVLRRTLADSVTM